MKCVGLFLIFLVLLLNVLHTNPIKIRAKIARITPNKIQLHYKISPCSRTYLITVYLYHQFSSVPFDGLGTILYQ